MLCGSVSFSIANDLTIKLNSPKVIISDIPTEISFELRNDQAEIIMRDTSFSIVGLHSHVDNQNQKINTLVFNQGVAEISEAVFPESGQAHIKIPEVGWKTDLQITPGWLSLLPPLVAILLALLARQVLVALFVGIWIGAALIYDYNPFAGFFYGLTEFLYRKRLPPYLKKWR